MGISLRGKRALVVGGSGGIGSAITEMLAVEGCELLIHGGHDAEKLERVVVRAREYGVGANPILLPLATADDGLALLRSVDRVDLLVVSFGPLHEAPLHSTAQSAWRMLVELNLLLPAILVSQVLPAMRENRFGRILLFGGPRTGELRPYRRIGAYAAAKSALASLTKSTALQNAAHNITCNMIAPGYVETEYYNRERIDAIASSLPMGRLVGLDEVARLARLLIAGDGEAVNGAIIPIDFGP
jgi:NAD(P)-dependent dehydrogenase (short-subunit alcohol dehydrogenase family)